MDARKRESGASSDSSSASSSSSDTVLIAKPLNQKHRKKLQAQLQAQQDERPTIAAATRTPSTVNDTSAAHDRTNGKSDLICLVCEHDGEHLVQCTGPCVAAFHATCIGLDKLPKARDTWTCPSCTSNTHVCFHCKRLGASVASDASTPVTTPATTSSASEELRPVRKCRALSCGKFYHSDCIAKLPLARIAGANFICPLHTCAACEQSGAKKESVRCMRCPVAYHTSCLPRNCRQDYPGKRIICPKHRTTSSRKANTIGSPILLADSQLLLAPDPPIESNSSSSATKRRDKSDKSDKSAKREKKKKKKSKRKKTKRRDRSASFETENDDGHDEHDGRTTGKTESDGALRIETRPIDTDADAVNDSFRPLGLHVAVPDAVSPATSSSLFESPATTNERIKARLVEALGQSDDDDDLDAADDDNATRAQSVSASDDEDRDSAAAASVVNEPHVDDDNASVQRIVASSPVPSPSPTASNSAHAEMLDDVASSHVAADNSSGSLDDGDSAADRSDSASPSSGEKTAGVATSSARRNVSAKDLSSDFSDAADRPRSASSSKKELDLSVQVAESSVRSRPQLLALQRVGGSGGVSAGEDGDDEGPGGASTPTLRRRTSTGTPRSTDSVGIAAAATDDAAKPKPSTAPRPNKSKKKKKKGRSEPVSDGPSALLRVSLDSVGPDRTDEAKWVQCDSCKKWRTVPKAIDLDAMPERWYCTMNTWDTAFASCAVPEEVVSTEAKKPKIHKKSRAKTPKPPRNAGSTSASASQTQTSTTGPSTGVLSVIGSTVGSDNGLSSPSSSGATSSTANKTAIDNTSTGSIDSDRHTLVAPTKKHDKHAKKRKLKLKEKYREVKWVQCEHATCGKWRVVPSTIDFERLPAVWFCHLNTWSPERATCDAPNPPDVVAFLSKASKKSDRRPSKKFKADALVAASGSGSTSDALAMATGLPTGAGNSAGALDAQLPSSRPPKAAKTSKGSGPPAAASAMAASERSSSIAATLSSASAPASAAASTVATVSSSSELPGLGTGSANAGIHTGTASVPFQPNSATTPKSRKAKHDGIKKTVLEWAQCEQCNKWRKLPQHIKSSTLPDKWFCSMNHWDSARASCDMPEEADQEPLLTASPLPSSQNWYPMPGQVGATTGLGSSNTGTGTNIRSKRSKLSYTELLYASTGQLRKTYTSESSTHTFELDGRVYRRDDQYKRSSMYVAPDAAMRLASSTKTTTGLSSTNIGTRTLVDADTDSLAQLAVANPLSVEQAAARVLDAMDLRRSCTVVELFHSLHNHDDNAASSSLSLALVAAAIRELVRQGLVEPQGGDRGAGSNDSDDPSSSSSGSGGVGTKRRRSTTIGNPALAATALNPLRQYRKVPRRPLKASKCWRLAMLEFPLQE